MAMTCAVFAAEPVTLSIKDMPVKTVISLLTEQSGVNIVMANDADMDKTITINLTDYDLDSAINVIAEASGLNYKKLADGTYVIGGVAAASTGALISPEALIGIPSEPAQESEIVPADPETGFQMIELVNTDCKEILKAMGWVDNDPNSYGVAKSHHEAYGLKHEKRRAQEMKFHSESGNTVKTYTDAGQPMAPAFNAANDFSDASRYGDINDALQQFGFGGPGGGPGGFGGGGGFGGAGGVGGVGGGTTGGRGGRSGTGTSGGNGGSWGNGLIPQDLEVYPYDLNNSILVKGSAADIAELKSIIQQLDIPPMQVEIKAEFIEISKGDTKKFGIDWQIGKIGKMFGTGTSDGSFAPGGNVYFNYSTGNLIASLQAQLTNTVGKVVNSPIISTVNNYPAEINIDQDIPYFTYTNTTDNGTVLSTYSVETESISSYLDVTPRINANNTITMYIDTQIEEVVSFVEDPQGGQVPQTLSQDMICIRNVYNGDTVVIGGFVRTNNSSTTNKIPLIADLPIIGNLFKTISKTIDERELLIFITPRIIEDSPKMQNSGFTEI